MAVSSEQYSLCWNNFTNHLTSEFDLLLKDDDLVDVTLCCEGGKIKAHKVMLSICSPYFKELFRENPCQHPIIVLRNISFEDLSAIVRFMYQGQVSVHSDRLNTFLQTAEFLEVRGLTDSNRASEEREIPLTPTPALSPVPVAKSPTRPKSPRNNAKRKKISKDDGQASPNSVDNYVHPKIEVPIEDIMCLDSLDEVIDDIKEYSPRSQTSPSHNDSSAGTSADGNFSVQGVTDSFKSSKMTTQSAGAEGEEGTEGGELLFRCRVCWKGFKHPMSLTLHRDSHQGKTQCPVCNRKFSRSYDMRSHLTRVHKVRLSLDAKLDFSETESPS